MFIYFGIKQKKMAIKQQSLKGAVFLRANEKKKKEKPRQV